MAGRPKKELDFDLIEKLASIMCTQSEIASICDCDVKTLQKNQQFVDVYKKGQEQGKMSLRRKQWKLADRSASMAIFLGKNYLGQSDVTTIKDDNAVTMFDNLVTKLKSIKEQDDDKES